MTTHQGFYPWFAGPPLRVTVSLTVVLLVAVLCVAPSPAQDAPKQTTTLQGPEVFRTVTDPQERSRALFVEAGKVILHPRCVNCHPQDDRPRQGMDSHLHEPPIVRGAGDHGVPAMWCNTCHQATNIDHARLPGHPSWHLAPRSMAWHGLSLGAICEQLKDPGRNGGKTLAQIHEHMAHDSLVGWGWSPGAGREPAPGTQQMFGALIAEWVDTGAECPAN
jgi:hypothetical protein